MSTADQSDDFEQLHALITNTADIRGFLDGMTGFAAAIMTRSTGHRIECAVTLNRRKRRASIAGSSNEAVMLDEIEQHLGQGPCEDALRTGAPVLVADVATDPRWPQYRESLEAAGCRSVLGIPLTLGPDASAVLNFFAPASGLFTEDAIADAEVFAVVAGQALHLALRIAAADQLAENLRAAMESRTAIDLACGIIMAQNRCSHDQAFEILRRGSSTRNQKLHALAEEIVAGVSGAPVAAAHFED
ncbi:GAF and ANTAR domain-containing protein [Arthrobacter globiformis]|uniref:GAF and ANTAR domain-containing protein n=1 Tax=Arthrobacter globiformis TaxID=1665 RepID=UPI000B416345|nr:GAF and ANTAR domain-containing protein [Arthrobacter globiformis]